MRIAMLLCASLALFISTTAQAQDDKSKAKELGNKAVQLEDEGRPDEAMPLLQESMKLDPENYVYPYEMVFCYRAKKEYKQALELMLKVLNYKGVKDDCYQMLGDIYDESGDSAMAMKTYFDGLKIFPNSGRLYVEIGNVFVLREQYQKAINYYEQGIVVEPDYPSNYYRATQVYLMTTDPVWGMMYGEIFMNLERNTNRTAQMSKWLYETYKRQIEIHSKDSMEVHFCKNMEVHIENGGTKGKMPFCMIYEPVMLISLVSTTAVETESLCAARRKFIEIFYERGLDHDNPNVLFEYQRKIAAAGFAEAYHHWILMKGDEKAFNNWKQSHEQDWENFKKWFAGNPLKLTTENEFARSKS